MSICSRVFLLALVPSLVVARDAANTSTREPSVLHVQTDRPTYRLGDTVWFRVHSRVDAPVVVELFGADGRSQRRLTLETVNGGPLAGRFFLDRQLSGGVFRVVATRTDGAIHSVPVLVHDVEVPALDLRLDVLKDIHYPGDSIVATLRARDLRGRPVVGAAVEVLAVFGEVRIREQGRKTDADGEALVRVALPAEVERSGFLTAGLALPRAEAAVSCPVQVSTAVARVEAFPEGGTIVPGHAHRVGLLVRDRQGEPTAAHGRVLDDQGVSVDGFHADAWGLASVVVPYEEGRSYQVVIDRPAGVGQEFPLPAETGHRYSMWVERVEESVEVEVRGTEASAGARLDVLLALDGRVRARRTVRMVSKSEASLAHARFPVAGGTGVAEIYLLDDGKALVRRPFDLGPRPPVTVRLEAKDRSPFVAGRPVELELTTFIGDRPVPADVSLSVFQGDPSGVPDLAARELFAGRLPPGVVVPPDLLADDDDARAQRERLFLVYSSFRYPPGGAPLAKGTGLPAATAGAVAPEPPPAPAQGALSSSRRDRRTLVRPTRFERLLRRAHFTRPVRESTAGDVVRVRVPDRMLLAASTNTGERTSPPQEDRLPPRQLDARRTLFWSERIRTDVGGKALVRFRLNHIVAGLGWVAQGHAAGLPVSGRGTIRPEADFTARLVFPQHLHVGDVFDATLDLTSVAESREVINVRLITPPALEPLARTAFVFDPRTDHPRQRFRFQALRPVAEGELRCVAVRGLYEHDIKRPVQVEDKEIELANGVSGLGLGQQTFAMTIPKDAVEGSVRLEGRVTPGFLARAIDDAAKRLRAPVGCFEQFTSRDLLNLVILDQLLEREDADPAVLRRAAEYAGTAHERLMTHLEPKSGAFALFPGEKPAVHATIVAVRHLALFAKTHDGTGRVELEGALRWLEAQELLKVDALYLTLILHDTGRTWRGSEAALRPLPVGAPLYHRVLRASCIARWPGEWPLEGTPRDEFLAAELDALEESFQRQDGRNRDGAGFMGVGGLRLEAETMALASVLFSDCGRSQSASQAFETLLEKRENDSHVEKSPLVVRAFGQMEPPSLEEAVEVRFHADPGGVSSARALPGQPRALRFRQPVRTAPGKEVSVGVDISGERPQPFELVCRYRVEEPVSSPTAPYRIRTSIEPRRTYADTEVVVHVSIVPAGTPPESQVVAKIGLPGGTEVDRDALEELDCVAKFEHWEVEHGCVQLYWAKGPEQPVEFRVLLRPVVTGAFRAQPSVVYPYYESGREAYAPALELEVFSGRALTPEEASVLRR